MVQTGFFKPTKKQRKFTALPASFDAYDLPSRTVMTRTLRASKLVPSLSSEPWIAEQRSSESGSEKQRNSTWIMWYLQERF